MLSRKPILALLSVCAITTKYEVSDGERGRKRM